MPFDGTYILFIVACFFELLFLYKRFKNQHSSVFSPPFFFFAFSIFYFCLSPLLLDYFNYKMLFSPVRLRHEDYLLTWSILNFIGLSMVVIISKLKIGYEPKRLWKFRNRRFVTWWLIFLFVTLFLQIWVYAHFGGISGYIRTYLSGSQAIVFKGYGVIFMISEAFPVIFVIGVGYFMSIGALSKKLFIPTIIVFAFLLILFGGLRGSRSMFVFRMFVGVGVLHYFGVKIKKSVMLFGVAFLIFFMFFYRIFYKNKTFASSSGVQSISLVDQKKLLQFIVITDLSRVDVQTLIIHQLERNDIQYNPGLGRTYLTAFNVLFPTAIYKGIFNKRKPPNKTFESSNLILGEGSYSRGRYTSYVHGLLGEGLLNFGIIGAILPFFFFGLYLKFINTYFKAISRADSRVIALPLLALSVVVLLQGDFDNFIFFLMNYAFLPWGLIFLASRKLKYLKYASTNCVSS